MRASRDVMAKRHEEIVSETSKMLRLRGIVGTSVIDLMRAVGLTHGGFYRHFRSKDELIANATRRVFDERIAQLRAEQRELGARAAIAAYVDDYLSSTHVLHPELGCPIAAFGADAAREGDAVKAAFSDGIKALVAVVSEGLDGSADDKQSRAHELLSLMAGALVTARASGDASLSDTILTAARVRGHRLITGKS